jgi:hypothetical protein
MQETKKIQWQLVTFAVLKLKQNSTQLCHALRHEPCGCPCVTKENELSYTGNDWVLNILANQKEDTRSQLLFIWWRAWHLRNNSIFGDDRDKILTLFAS